MTRTEPSPSPPPKPGDALATFTPEELETIRRQSLLRQYGCVEGFPEDDLASALDRPSKEGLPSEEKKAEDERRRRVMEAVRLDSRKKKHKKQREGMFVSPLSAGRIRWGEGDADVGRGSGSDGAEFESR